MADVIFEGGTELYDGSGVGGALGYLLDYNYFESSIPNAAAEAESLGLAFGERIHLNEPEDWGPFPLQPETWYSGTYDFDQDGFCFGYVKHPFYSLHLLPDSISLDNISDDEFYGDYQVVSYAGGGGQASFSIPVKADEKIVVRGIVGAYDNTYESNFFWTPIEASPLSNSEQSITSQEVYFDSPQQYIHLEEPTDHVLVGGNNYTENGCSGCAYNYHLVLPEGDIPDGYEILVWYSPNVGEAPYFQVFSNSVPNEILNERSEQKSVKATPTAKLTARL